MSDGWLLIMISIVNPAILRDSTKPFGILRHSNFLSFTFIHSSFIIDVNTFRKLQHC
jgi:hypothetical protein